MKRFSKADIDYHSAGPAINVKVYHYPRCSQVEDAFKCSEAVAAKALEYAFECAQQRFWEDAQEVARNIFAKGHSPAARLMVKVEQRGRSGGWLIVNGIDQEVETWDAIRLGKWARMVKWCADEIAYLTSWEYVKEDIEANEWAKDGAEMYNFLELKDGRTVTMSELKNANKEPA